MKHTGKLHKWVTGSGLHYILDEQDRFIFHACSLEDGIDNAARREELAANSDHLVELWNFGLSPSGVKALEEAAKEALDRLSRLESFGCRRELWYGPDGKPNTTLGRLEAALAGIKEE